MPASPVQKFLAYAAAFLLPMPVLHFGISFTIGDVFLVLAIAFNLNEVLRIQSFQLPILAAFPLILTSELLDSNSTLVSILQVIYLWGFVMPFGWCAFTHLEPRRIAQVLLAAAALNCIVAAGQGLGVLPILERQRNISIHGEFNRAPGLSASCNSLMMELTPCAPLLPFLPYASQRITSLLLLLAGGVSSVSKAMVLAIPGMLFYFYREPRKLMVVLALAVMGGAGGVILEQDDILSDAWYRLSDGLDHRTSHLGESLEDRWELIQIAREFLPECAFLGFGTGGTVIRVGQNTNSTVHVYALGLILIGGFPAMLLILCGFLIIVRGLYRAREIEFFWSLVAHILACLVTTVLMFSFQSVPLMIAGAVLARHDRLAASAAAAARIVKRVPLRRAA